MTPEVRTYEYQDLSKKAGPAKPEIRPYEEPKFQAHVNGNQVDSIHKKLESFRLDPLVSNQLGVEDREKAAMEERARKEIEHRWELAAGKAEVEGYTRGLEEGKKEAVQAELPRIRERIEKLDFLIGEFDSFRQKIFNANEAFLMDLIMQVASMVTLKEVALDKDYIRRLVTNLLQHLGTKDDIKIHLSAFDFENMNSLREALDKEFGKLQHTTIEPSPDVPVGGCKIETRFGVVDASIQAQIENISKSLKG